MDILVIISKKSAEPFSKELHGTFIFISTCICLCLRMKSYIVVDMAWQLSTRWIFIDRSSPLPDSSLIRNGKSRKQKKIWALCIGSNNFNWHVICISTSWATLDRWDKVSLMIVMMMVPCMSCLPVLKCERIRVHMTWFLITDNFRSVWHAFSGSILKNTSDYSNDSIE